MSLYILHPQSVTTPNYSSSLTKIRNVSTPILPRYCTTRSITVCDRQLPSIRAIPVQNVQRSEKSTTVLQQPIEELLGLNVQGEQPVRKRECLNHLTAEEKQNRRKLKNRVAAQTARDRKKYRASKLEEAVRTLILENRKLREENKCLKKTCEELKSRNVELQELLNNNEEREESCSETEISSSNNVPSSSLGSAEGTGDDAIVADFNAFLSSYEMQEIIGEICATDGTDSTLQDVDGTALEFERFCSEILSEVDDPLTTSDSTETKSPKSHSSTRRMDCTTPDIIIAPEYLKPDLEPRTSPTFLNVSNENVMDYTELSSLANSDMENDHSVKCEQSSGYSSSAPSKSPEVLRHISSSPSPFTFLSNIKEENNDTSSPLISDNDPMFCIPHKWDVDDDYM